MAWRSYIDHIEFINTKIKTMLEIMTAVIITTFFMALSRNWTPPEYLVLEEIHDIKLIAIRILEEIRKK